MYSGKVIFVHVTTFCSVLICKTWLLLLSPLHIIHHPWWILGSLGGALPLATENVKTRCEYSLVESSLHGLQFISKRIFHALCTWKALQLCTLADAFRWLETLLSWPVKCLKFWTTYKVLKIGIFFTSRSSFLAYLEDFGDKFLLGLPHPTHGAVCTPFAFQAGVICWRWAWSLWVVR